MCILLGNLSLFVLTPFVNFSRILSARSADEFYSCMGGGAGAVWDAGDALVARVVAFGSAPELPRLRSMHRYRVAPPAPPAAAPMYQPPLHSAVSLILLSIIYLSQLFYFKIILQNEVILSTDADNDEKRLTLVLL